MCRVPWAHAHSHRQWNACEEPQQEVRSGLLTPPLKLSERHSSGAALVEQPPWKSPIINLLTVRSQSIKPVYYTPITHFSVNLPALWLRIKKVNKSFGDAPLNRWGLRVERFWQLQQNYCKVNNLFYFTSSSSFFFFRMSTFHIPAAAAGAAGISVVRVDCAILIYSPPANHQQTRHESKLLKAFGEDQTHQDSLGSCWCIPTGDVSLTLIYR